TMKGETPGATPQPFKDSVELRKQFEENPASESNYVSIIIGSVSGLPKRSDVVSVPNPAKNGYFCEVRHVNGSEEKLIFRTITQKSSGANTAIFTEDIEAKDKFGVNV